MEKINIPGFQVIGSSAVPTSLLNSSSIARQVPDNAMAADVFERLSRGALASGPAVAPAYLLLVKPSAERAKPEPVFKSLGITPQGWVQLSESQRTMLTDGRDALVGLKISADEWLFFAQNQRDILIKGHEAIVALSMTPHEWLYLAQSQRDALIKSLKPS